MMWDYGVIECCPMDDGILSGEVMFSMSFRLA